MGAAFGDLPSMAAQSRYVAGKFAADSTGLRANGRRHRHFEPLRILLSDFGEAPP